MLSKEELARYGSWLHLNLLHFELTLILIKYLRMILMLINVSLNVVDMVQEP